MKLLLRLQLKKKGDIMKSDSNSQWYKKILAAILIIILLPFITFCLIFVFIFNIFDIPGLRKQYKDSHYYKDLNVPFNSRILDSEAYRFYNSAKNSKLPFKFVRQESNELEYVIYDNTIYVFFDRENYSIDYNEEKREWEITCDEVIFNLEKACNELFSKLDNNAPDLPIKLFLERKMISCPNL